MPSPGFGDDETPRSPEQSPPGPRLGDGPDPGPDLDDAELTLPPGQLPLAGPGDRFGADPASGAGRPGAAPDPLQQGPGPGHVSWPPPYTGPGSPLGGPAADSVTRGPVQPPGPPIPSAPPRFGGLTGPGGPPGPPTSAASAWPSPPGPPAAPPRTGPAGPVAPTDFPPPGPPAPPGPPGGLAGPPGPLYYAPPIRPGSIPPGTAGAPGTSTPGPPAGRLSREPHLAGRSRLHGTAVPRRPRSRPRTSLRPWRTGPCRRSARARSRWRGPALGGRQRPRLPSDPTRLDLPRTPRRPAARRPPARARPPGKRSWGAPGRRRRHGLSRAVRGSRWGHRTHRRRPRHAGRPRPRPGGAQRCRDGGS